jgi:CubicO group peptidase (beta-lactamase class C family)
MHNIFARWLALFAAIISAPAMANCSSCEDITRNFAKKEGFNGVVLVAQGSRVDYVESFGVMNASTRAPLSADTRFETGSISKWIAAIVVMRLVQQGQLSLDEPITRYLPGYRKDTGRKITLRWLMSHSSGVPNEIDAAVKQDPTVKELSLENDTAVRKYASGDLRFEPGTDWDYSHSNWLIVKAVVEKVTGQNYGDLVNRILLQPLALHNSGVWVGDSANVPGMALGYRQLDPQPEPLRKPNPDFLVMAGGYYASANDMLQLMDGLFAGKLLSPKALNTLMTVIRPDQHYALGGRAKILDTGDKPRLVAWEYGSNGAFRVLAWRVIEDGHTVIVMNNTSFDHMKIGALATQLLDASYLVNGVMDNLNVQTGDRPAVR